jgi:hypothetical protein
MFFFEKGEIKAMAKNIKKQSASEIHRISFIFAVPIIANFCVLQFRVCNMEYFHTKSPNFGAFF